MHTNFQCFLFELTVTVLNFFFKTNHFNPIRNVEKYAITLVR